MKSVLILADVIAPLSDDNKRQMSDYVQYRASPYLHVALGYVPHAPLLGPVLLGTVLKAQGYGVQIVECAFRPQQKRNLLAALTNDPDYVLISTTFIESIGPISNLVDLVRLKAPGAKIILGGPSLLSDVEMRKLGDYSIIGEGEVALPSLLACLDRGELPERIAGVCYFQAEQMKFTPPALLPDLDQIPLPDWSLVRRGKDEFFSMATQRGCYWRCAFCSYPANEGYKLRYFSIPRLIEEMKRNFELFGIHNYVFADSTFTHPHDRCLEFLEAVTALPFQVQWVAYGRVDTITEPLAKAMKNSGCQGIFFGCDSGDSEILLKMNKRFTLDQIRQGVSLLKNAGVPATASWIVGFPGETDESVQNTLDLILELKCDLNVVHAFTIYSQAPVGMRKEKFGVEGDSTHWVHETMSSEQASRWTRRVILRMLAAGLQLGTAHDVSWMSTVGLNALQSRDFFREAQTLSVRKFRLKPSRLRPSFAKEVSALDETRFYEKCELIRGIGQEHPIFKSQKT